MPIKVLENLSGQKVIDVASGYYHIVVRISTGKIYSWGLNRNGQFCFFFGFFFSNTLFMLIIFFSHIDWEMEQMICEITQIPFLVLRGPKGMGAYFLIVLMSETAIAEELALPQTFVNV